MSTQYIRYPNNTGGGMVIGDLVVGGSPSLFLYTDVFGNLFQDPQASRNSSAAKQTLIQSNIAAMLSLDDGSTQSVVVADTVGSAGNLIQLTFDGLIDINQAIIDWNTLNPGNTCSLDSGTGTEIIAAGTYSLVGGGTSGFNSGRFSTLAGDVEGTGFLSEDTDNTLTAIMLTGNIANMTADNGLGVLAGVVGATGFGIGIFSAERVKILSTDQSTYNANVELDSAGASLGSNGNGFLVDLSNSRFVFSTSGGDEITIPFNFTAPNLGDVLVVSSIIGNTYELDFASPSGGLPSLTANNIWVGDGSNVATASGSNFTFDLSNLNFYVGDFSSIANDVYLTVNNTSNFIDLGAPTGVISIGDNAGNGNSLLFRVDNSSNESALSGYLPVNGSLANIDSSGVTGLNAMAVSGVWFDTTSASYTVTITDNNKKFFYLTSASAAFNIGDTISNSGNLTETAVIIDVEVVSPTDYRIVADQSYGPWLTVPAGVTITAGVNVGATAAVSTWNDDVDIYSLTGTVSQAICSTQTAVLINGAAIGWSAFTGHTIGDVWIISFSANNMPAFDFDFDNRVFDFAVHQGVPQSASPKGIRISQPITGIGLLEIGNIAQNDYKLSFGLGGVEQLVYHRGVTAQKFLVLSTQTGEYRFGDIDGVGNQNNIAINDTAELFNFYVSDSMSVHNPVTNTRYFRIDYTNAYAGLGDLDLVDNGSYVLVRDADESVELKANETIAITDAVIRGSALHNNALAQGSATEQDVRSGTYSPTITGVTNVTTATLQGTAQWMRVGNVVTVSVAVEIDPAGAGTTSIGISLPVASNFATAFECNGGGHALATNGHNGPVYGDAANDRAEYTYPDPSGSTDTHRIMFQYEVI